MLWPPLCICRGISGDTAMENPVLTKGVCTTEEKHHQCHCIVGQTCVAEISHIIMGGWAHNGQCIMEEVGLQCQWGLLVRH